MRETEVFAKKAASLLTDEQKDEVIDFIAFNPLSGDIIKGTGGIRKVRIALPGRGKSGGARVVYYYHDDRIPMLALYIFAKNEAEDLSNEGRKALSRLVSEYKTEARKRI